MKLYDYFLLFLSVPEDCFININSANLYEMNAIFSHLGRDEEIIYLSELYYYYLGQK